MRKAAATAAATAAAAEICSSAAAGKNLEVFEHFVTFLVFLDAFGRFWILLDRFWSFGMCRYAPFGLMRVISCSYGVTISHI